MESKEVCRTVFRWWVMPRRTHSVPGSPALALAELDAGGLRQGVSGVSAAPS